MSEEQPGRVGGKRKWEDAMAELGVDGQGLLQELSQGASELSQGALKKRRVGNDGKGISSTSSSMGGLKEHIKEVKKYTERSPDEVEKVGTAIFVLLKNGPKLIQQNKLKKSDGSFFSKEIVSHIIKALLKSGYIEGIDKYGYRINAKEKRIGNNRGYTFSITKEGREFARVLGILIANTEKVSGSDAVTTVTTGNTGEPESSLGEAGADHVARNMEIDLQKKMPEVIKETGDAAKRTVTPALDSDLDMGRLLANFGKFRETIAFSPGNNESSQKANYGTHIVIGKQ